MSSKTIALLLPDLRVGGAERVALSLMRSFRAAGHRVEFVLMDKKGELLSEVPSDVRIVDLGARRVRHAIRPLVRYLRQSRPDAMQVSLWPLTVAAILARRIARSTARLVVSDHAALSKQFAGRPLTLAAIGASVRLFYRRADARVMVATAAAEDLARLSGLPRECFDIVYNPVERPADRIGPTSEIEAMWRDADGRIITVGTLKAQKNHELLIRSFARVRESRPARLMILGSGELETHLKQLAASLGIGDDVIFPGFAADPWPYYASSNLFALSSDYEGYPLVLVEAMRCGLPVVSTDCESGPREILDGGKFGRLVPVGDERALAGAMMEELEKPHFAGLARERAEQLSGAGTARRYLELLLGPD
jgi:glycosyltransferase involved in cell wall biosynthesis